MTRKMTKFAAMLLMVIAVTLTGQANQGNAAQDSQLGTVTGVQNGLNVRAQPNSGSTIIGGLSNGTQVTIHSIDEHNWAQIDYNGGVGYISMTYVTLNNAPSAVQGKTIAIDPGHGGSDPGAEAFGLQEKEIALDVGLRVEEKLRNAGAEVVMTRTADTYVGLSERAQIANQADADSFVSIHANAFDGSAEGSETYHHPVSNEGKELAESIQEELIRELGTTDRGVHDAHFAVLNETAMPATLVEIAFVDNASDAEQLKTNEFREKAANAIVQGIENYYSSK
ncbi:N-acetylmuramoyl-L-alanine amidase [Thalassorhabdus alkalitolerans]|uniref:N-acetylmuramoyl-L-alanine amidase n=1 Tax=Thalassorhabdus alkalitolerans TaxID=2282697 RepID=A0ABW0YG21_9BACI